MSYYECSAGMYIINKKSFFFFLFSTSSFSPPPLPSPPPLLFDVASLPHPLLHLLHCIFAYSLFLGTQVHIQGLATNGFEANLFIQHTLCLYMLNAPNHSTCLQGVRWNVPKVVHFCTYFLSNIRNELSYKLATAIQVKM